MKTKLIVESMAEKKILFCHHRQIGIEKESSLQAHLLSQTFNTLFSLVYGM
jgi:hypothetical protein